MRSNILAATAMQLALVSRAFEGQSRDTTKDTIPIELLGLNNPIRKDRLRAMGLLRSRLNYRRSIGGGPGRNTARERGKYLRKNKQELHLYVVFS